jgi:hypothetical protein
MVKKSLRRKIIINVFNFKNAPNSKKNVPGYLNGREGSLVRVKIEDDIGFSWNVYSGKEDKVYKFVKYNWEGSVVEYLVHQNNLIIRSPQIRRHSIDSKVGKEYMEIINRTKFMEFTSI